MGRCASLLSVIEFNFLFTVPRFTLAADDPDYPVTFFIMLLASMLSSSLATRVKKQARQSAQKAYYMELLHEQQPEAAAGAGRTGDHHGLPQSRSSRCWTVRCCMRWQFRIRSRNSVSTPAEEAAEWLTSLTLEEQGVADWVIRNNKRAGATHRYTAGSAQNLYLSVRGNLGVMGYCGDPGPELAAAGQSLRKISSSPF